MLLKGNCLELLAEMPDNSVDSIVTDPPYELGFMGKSWDNSGIAYSVELWSQALRVLKPGGHLLAFGGSRTYHRLASAVEDAGFEIRDQIMWLYGSGFPKSLDVSKAIDKAAGAEREVVGHNHYANRRPNAVPGEVMETGLGINHDITAPATLKAQQWQGWGTALKPAHEPIVVARKPLIGTVAANVLTYGTGAMNIDGSRVPSDDGFEKAWDKPVSTNISAQGGKYISEGNQHTVDLTSNRPVGGRWPANVIHDGSEEVLEGFPDTGKSTGGRIGKKSMGAVTNVPAGDYQAGDPGYGDSGSAARFFYCAKASKSERNAGLEGFELKRESDRPSDDKPGGDNPRNRTNTASQNFHPTVKPIALMRYLVKLVTPPNGTVLDPFLGSGTTAVAAILEGFNWMGCEMTEDYWPIIEARVAWAEAQPKTLL